MVVTMLCTVASRSWVAVTEMGFSPSIPTLQVFPTYDTSNHVGLTECTEVNSMFGGDWYILKESN